MMKQKVKANNRDIKPTCECGGRLNSKSELIHILEKCEKKMMKDSVGIDPEIAKVINEKIWEIM